MGKIINKFLSLLNSRRFFKVILALFAFESIWIAFSAAYPQAFDENFHFGLIQIYSHYWLPFLSGQPPNADAYGAVARDPSYLYHYLMSFPFRLIALVVHGQIGQVILLRIINIGLLSGGLILFRRVLLRVGISRALSNTILFLFMLIPVVPQLAAQINYDNLLIPLVAWACLLTFDLTDQIKAHKPTIRTLATLFIVCLLSSLVKYAFMPIALGVAIFLLIILIQNYRHQWEKLLPSIKSSWVSQTLLAKTVLVGLVVISLGMFIQRDGVNIIKYHSIAPSCSSILTVNQCKAYSPWNYNYISHNSIKNSTTTIKYYNPVLYLGEWIYWMWYRLFFAINGPNSSFTNYPPLPLPSAAAAVIAIAGVILITKWRKRVFKGDSYLIFLLIVSAVYIIALIAQGYSTYRYTNVLENMNGRYLLPILLLIAAIAGRAFSIAIGKDYSRKAIFTFLALLLFLQGGGVLTFIARSDESWDFQNKDVVKVNNAARRIADPVLVNGKKTYSSSIWFFN